MREWARRKAGASWGVVLRRGAGYDGQMVADVTTSGGGEIFRVLWLVGVMFLPLSPWALLYLALLLIVVLT